MRRFPPTEADTPQLGPLALADSINRQPETGKPKRTLPAGIERLLGIDDLATLLSCSRRLVERMRAAGKIPLPDMYIGKMPRWWPERIRRWVEEGCRP